MKVLIIDATNQFLRNYAVVPTLDRNGNPNGAIYGFLNSLGYFTRITNPDKIIIVWDGAGGSTKRRKIIKEYKEGRKPVRINRNFEFEFENLEENKIVQRMRLGQYLNDLPITQICIDDIEADDVIAYLTKVYHGERKIIVSSDRDFIQLLDKVTVIFNPGKKEFISNKDAIDKYNIHPKNFALTRAIVGDKSDNLLGVRGIGMKNVLKYFPFLSGEEKVELDQIFTYCEKEGVKYERFLAAREVVTNNLKVMNLNEILIGFNSTDKIHNNLKEELHFNATSFRMKLIEDGIASIGEPFLNQFKVLQFKGKNK